MTGREIDPARPAYHYTSGNWMNDVIPFHDGTRLHVYFDHNPEAAAWTRFGWGHATTNDLVHWTDETLALQPGEPGTADHLGCWTGCVFEVDGGYAAAYTGIPSFDPFTQTQCLARSEDLRTWVQTGRAMIADVPDGFGQCFRDPHVWRTGDTWSMLVGSTRTDTNQAAQLLYRSRDLEEWTYLGPFFVAEHDEFLHHGECPDLFELDGRTVLIMSAEHTRAVTGDVVDDRFAPDGPVTVLDPGESYAAKTFGVGDRRILLAWVRDTTERSSRAARGWSGALSLPRELSIREDGSVRSVPIPELVALRAEEVHDAAMSLTPSGLFVEGVASHTVEVEIALDGRQAGRFSAVVGCDPDGSGGMRCDLDLDARTLNGHELHRDEELRDLRIFLDRSVLEVFVGGSLVTLRSYDLSDSPSAMLSGPVGMSARVRAWHLEPSEVPAC